MTRSLPISTLVSAPVAPKSSTCFATHLLKVDFHRQRSRLHRHRPLALVLVLVLVLVLLALLPVLLLDCSVSNLQRQKGRRGKAAATASA
jgi:hypothetical protein